MTSMPLGDVPRPLLVTLDKDRRKDPATLGTLYHLKKIELVREEARNELRGELAKEAFEHYALSDVVRLLAT